MKRCINYQIRTLPRSHSPIASALTARHTCSLHCLAFHRLCKSAAGYLSKLFRDYRAKPGLNLLPLLAVKKDGSQVTMTFNTEGSINRAIWNHKTGRQPAWLDYLYARRTRKAESFFMTKQKEFSIPFLTTVMRKGIDCIHDTNKEVADNR